MTLPVADLLSFGALGVKTSLKALAEVGTVPVVMMVTETVFLAAWIIAGTWMLDLG